MATPYNSLQHRQTNLQRVLTTLNKLVWLAGIAVVGWFAESQHDGGLIGDVWLAAKTASPFAAMFAILAWLDERRERREAQRQCMDRTIEFLEANNFAHSSLEKAITALTTAQLKSSGPRGRK